MSFLNRRREAQQPPVSDNGVNSGFPATTPIADVQPRRLVAVCGKVTRMTARPTTGQPALALRITDGTGTVVAVWTGRRSIGGVTLGRRIIVEGVPMQHGANLEFTNPNYTLLPRQD